MIARNVGWALALVLVSLAASSARAQDEDYAHVIAEAVSEFDAHRFDEARALFRSAHALAPSARTERGIGLTSFELRDYVEAYLMLTAALADERRPLTDEQRADATELLTRTAHFVGRFTFTVPLGVDASAVLVDGAAPSLTPSGAAVIALGTHDVSVRAEGYAMLHRSLSVAGAEEQTMALELVRVSTERASTPSALEPAATPPALRTPIAAASGPDRTAPIALLITGGVLGGVALATTFAWWASVDGELGVCAAAGAGTACTNRDALANERTAAGAASIGLGVLSAAALLSSLVLFVASGRADATATRCAPTGLGVVCAGTF